MVCLLLPHAEHQVIVGCPAMATRPLESVYLALDVDVDVDTAVQKDLLGM